MASRRRWTDRVWGGAALALGVTGTVAAFANVVVGPMIF